SVTATKGGGTLPANNSIGKNHSYYNQGTCGTINIGGTEYPSGATPNQGDGKTFVYPVPVPSFSVSATKTVVFAPGNLQYNGSTHEWRFAEHQWDYCQTSGGTWNTSSWVDLFGWGTWTGSSPNPLNTSTDNNDYSFASTDFDQTLQGSDAWRTLTDSEQGYLFDTRASGATVNSTSNARYTEATINTDGTGVNGIILFPDGVTIASDEATTWGVINDGTDSNYGTKCTAAQWTALEAKGCVFLPAASYRYGTSVDGSSIGTYGGYWSSTTIIWHSADYLTFRYDYVYPMSGSSRIYGRSVRLVRDAN
nr:hypothetical protein [Bacteroidales bacterium]